MSEPLSVMQSLVTPKFSEELSKIPPEWLQMKEADLIPAIGGWDVIGPIDLDLRRNFWAHYPAAIISEEPLKNETLYTGICSVHTFYKIISDPKRLAFMVCEPETEKQKAQHMLFLAWIRIKEILSEKPEVNPRTGKKDVQLMALQEKIFKYLDQRENGALIQRVHHEVNQKTLQVNMTAEQAKEAHQHLTPAQVDARLAELEERTALPPAQRQPDILDAITHHEKQVYTTNASVMTDKRKG